MSDVTVEQLFELHRQIKKGDITYGKLEDFLKGRLKFYYQLGNATEQLRLWDGFYRSEFGIELDVADVSNTLIQMPDGFGRLIVVAKDMTLSRVLSVCKKRFGECCYTKDPDKDVCTNDRTPDRGSYAVWVRDSKQVDKEFVNISANKLKRRKVSGITLLERLLLELIYFSQTCNNLDRGSITLCAGSRDSQGNVPYITWDDSMLGCGFEINACPPNYSYDEGNMGTRRVIFSPV